MIMAIPRNPSSRGIRPSIFFPSSVFSMVVNVSEIRRWDRDEQSHSFQAQYGTRLDYSWHNADPGAAMQFITSIKQAPCEKISDSELDCTSRDPAS